MLDTIIHPPCFNLTDSGIYVKINVILYTIDSIYLGLRAKFGDNQEIL